LGGVSGVTCVVSPDSEGCCQGQFPVRGSVALNLAQCAPLAGRGAGATSQPRAWLSVRRPCRLLLACAGRDLRVVVPSGIRPSQCHPKLHRCSSDVVSGEWSCGPPAPGFRPVSAADRGASERARCCHERPVTVALVLLFAGGRGGGAADNESRHALLPAVVALVRAVVACCSWPPGTWRGASRRSEPVIAIGAPGCVLCLTATFLVFITADLGCVAAWADQLAVALAACLGAPRGRRRRCAESPPVLPLTRGRRVAASRGLSRCSPLGTTNWRTGGCHGRSVAPLCSASGAAAAGWTSSGGRPAPLSA